MKKLIIIAAIALLAACKKDPEKVEFKKPLKPLNPDHPTMIFIPEKRDSSNK